MGKLAWVAEMKAKRPAVVNTRPRRLWLASAECAIAEEPGAAYFSTVGAMGSLRSWALVSRRHHELPEQP
jgi:hypothetical protein